ncbi:class I SAM-dependent methyltransferase [Streptoalloteichus tenebrarius]|uniref:class I SAM-dependent methyltransferase n=1 Tax=Streptoalloteichus tenebrarius (strain ATCC 17920 / DSM 40477 / JCM 4838 / CBS 697.72 / NBRC 16177 / NCIMB 11028 / NRRL B-12390 / A12253. 1 / ISP 5477) TaxID=1933 RepID=UPI003558EE18
MRELHQLPLPEASVDVAVAAFCLYHSPRPEQVVTAIAGRLASGGHAGAGHQVRRQLPRDRPGSPTPNSTPTRPTGRACTRASTVARRRRSPPLPCVSYRSSTRSTCSSSPGSTASPPTWLRHPSASYPNTGRK